MKYGYTAEQAENLERQFEERQRAAGAALLDIISLADQLTAPRARTFAKEGIARRLKVIERCATNIFEIYPPGRQELLSMAECDDVAIQFQSFVMNVYAIFDNIAWIAMLEAGESLLPTKICVYKAECNALLPPKLRAYLDQSSAKDWFGTYGKVYRDSTAHRIAPYLPSRAFTPDDGQRWQEVHADAMNHLRAAANEVTPAERSQLLDEHERLTALKETLGGNSLLVGLSLTGEDYTNPIYLHPQVLCDWWLSQELVREFCAAMRESEGWASPKIPEQF